MRIRLPTTSFRHWGPPALVALAALAGILCAVDPAGDYPALASGPGVTVDESFNVQHGVRLAETVPLWVAGSLSLVDVFGEREDLGNRPPVVRYHLPDHPPLGRLWIGAFHNLACRFAPPADHATPFVTACARTAPATAFALLVFLVGYAAANWYGGTAGLVAALALVLMPRLFGHAHLAALETFIGLAYAATVLSVAVWWSKPAGPSMRVAAWTGLVFGLALLTKIQAVLLPVPIAVWALFYYRRRAILPLVVWSAVGLLALFAFWPWLWLDPLGHFAEYFGRTTDRAELHVWYLGRRFVDRAVPWHYPLVMFLTTVPVGLHLLGLLGAAPRRALQKVAGFARIRIFIGRPNSCEFGYYRDEIGSHSVVAGLGRREQLVLACVMFPLVVFALPGIAVYDGARLFLVVFPLWAIFVGRGASQLLGWLRQKTSRRTAAVALTALIALQSIGLLAVRPCYLSYYNLLVGGLWGAERLGFEPTYWGDSVTRGFLHEVAQAVPAGTTIEVAPVLHQFQWPELVEQSPILRRRQIALWPYDPQQARRGRHVLFFRRKADLPESLRPPPEPARLVAEVRRQGVQLAALYEFSPPAR